MSDQAEASTVSSPPPPHERPPIPRRRVRWTATKCFAAGTLVATFANVGVAIYQWKAMQRQAKIMERQTGAMEEANRLTKAAQQEALTVAADADRPWVSVYITEVPAITPRVKPQVRLTLLNTGKTPATHVVAVYSFTVPTKLPTTPEFTGQRDGPFVILPVGPVERTLAVDTELSPQHIKEIQSEKRWFVVRAEVTYRDRIGRDHRTSFCQFSSGGSFNACIGNDAK